MLCWVESSVPRSNWRMKCADSMAVDTDVLAPGVRSPMAHRSLLRQAVRRLLLFCAMSASSLQAGELAGLWFRCGDASGDETLELASAGHSYRWTLRRLGQAYGATGSGVASGGQLVLRGCSYHDRGEIVDKCKPERAPVYVTIPTSRFALESRNAGHSLRKGLWVRASREAMNDLAEKCNP